MTKSLNRALMLSLVVLAIVSHLASLSLSPNGYHRWREADTATVAENFAIDGSAAKPRVNVVGGSMGVVGTELPVYTYATALLYQIFGFHHAWPRLLSLLAYILALFGLRQLMAVLGEGKVAQNLIAYLALCSPLMFFYGAKIQPDMLGFALLIWGYVWFRHWLSFGRSFFFLASAVALALAGGIKPIYLFVGLPMTFDLLNHVGWKGVFRPLHLLFAAIVMVPLVTWYPYATRLSDSFGEQYFYLGGNLPDFSFWLSKWSFYQNSLLTWPWEMVVGLPSLVFFMLGWRRAWQRQRIWLLAWTVGCFIIFVLAAANVATPHDYYYLPMVAPLLYVTALGYLDVYTTKPIWAQRLATAVLVLLPIFALVRVGERYNYNDRFFASRTKTATYVPADERILAVDRTPGYLLYMVGRSGHRLGVDAKWADVLEHVKHGYQTLAIETGNSLRINPLLTDFIQLVFEEQEFSMVSLREDLHQGDGSLRSENVVVPLP